MEKRKIEKATCLVLGTVIIVLSTQGRNDWEAVGLYSECSVGNRFLYSVFHANILHAILNVSCLWSLVFRYDIKLCRLILSYLIASTIPIDTICALTSCSTTPTVGLSGVVYFLFGTISFEVIRQYYYQMCMVGYLLIGFLSQHTNGWVHLYCYIVGFIIALINKPIKLN